MMVNLDVDVYTKTPKTII